MTVIPPGRASATTIAGIVLFLTAGLLFTSLDTIAKYLTREYSIFQVAWARYTFAVVAMMALVPPAYRRRPLASAWPALQLLRSTLLAGVTLMFFLAVSHLPLADVTAVSFATPLIVTALGALVLGETVGVRRWTAVFIGFCGVLIIVRPTGTVHWAVFVTLAMAAGNAVFQILTRVASRYDSPHTSASYTAIVGAIVLTAAAPFVWKTPDLLGWVLHVLIGLAGGVGHYALASAYNQAPASTLAPFTYLQLVWITIAGLVVFGDFPDGWTILGAAIVVASGIYVFYREARRRREAAGTQS
jgi:drug/metabolite transporter (DMT)-like permease